MDKREKLNAMDKMLRELEDVKNTQTSALKKIAQVEAENINIGIALLDQTLPEVHEHIDKVLVDLDDILAQFTEHRNKFSKDNKLEEAEETGTS